MNHNLRVNRTNFHMKGFTLGLALKQRQSTSTPLLLAQRHTPLSTHLCSIKCKEVLWLKPKLQVHCVIDFTATDKEGASGIRPRSKKSQALPCRTDVHKICPRCY